MQQIYKVSTPQKKGKDFTITWCSLILPKDGLGPTTRTNVHKKIEQMNRWLHEMRVFPRIEMSVLLDKDEQVIVWNVFTNEVEKWSMSQHKKRGKEKTRQERKKKMWEAIEENF